MPLCGALYNYVAVVNNRYTLNAVQTVEENARTKLSVSDSECNVTKEKLVAVASSHRSKQIVLVNMPVVSLLQFILSKIFTQSIWGKKPLAMRGCPQDQNFIHVASTSRTDITLCARTAERNDTRESMYVLFLLAVLVSNALCNLLRQVQIAAFAISTCYNQQDIRLVAASEDWVTMKLK